MCSSCWSLQGRMHGTPPIGVPSSRPKFETITLRVLKSRVAKLKTQVRLYSCSLPQSDVHCLQELSVLRAEPKLGLPTRPRCLALGLLAPLGEPNCRT